MIVLLVEMSGCMESDDIGETMKAMRTVITQSRQTEPRIKIVLTANEVNVFIACPDAQQLADHVSVA